MSIGELPTCECPVCASSFSCSLERTAHTVSFCKLEALGRYSPSDQVSIETAGWRVLPVCHEYMGHPLTATHASCLIHFCEWSSRQINTKKQALCDL